MLGRPPPVLVAEAAKLADHARERAAALSDGYDLTLIGRRQLRSNNSWMHNSARLMKGADRCTALLHPDDAGARGLDDGDTVRVVSRVGAIELPLEVSDEIRRRIERDFDLDEERLRGNVRGIATDEPPEIDVPRD